MNTVILKAQFITGLELDQIKKPYQGKKFKKVFFQPELRQFVNGDAIFGLVAYGGYKQFGKLIGPPLP
ncbi:MAG TPA: hypothetical protein VFX58_03755, partial [Chitinophagaceae bacterium]|nr:hypothetical protein [Chitinophagaceae bacterium]